jgi:hypothetical protein
MCEKYGVELCLAIVSKDNEAEHALLKKSTKWKSLLKFDSLGSEHDLFAKTYPLNKRIREFWGVCNTKT